MPKERLNFRSSEAKPEDYTKLIGNVVEALFPLSEPLVKNKKNRENEIRHELMAVLLKTLANQEGLVLSSLFQNMPNFFSEIANFSNLKDKDEAALLELKKAVNNLQDDQAKYHLILKHHGNAEQIKQKISEQFLKPLLEQDKETNRKKQERENTAIAQLDQEGYLPANQLFFTTDVRDALFLDSKHHTEELKGVRVIIEDLRLFLDPNNLPDWAKGEQGVFNTDLGIIKEAIESEKQ